MTSPSTVRARHRRRRTSLAALAAGAGLTLAAAAVTVIAPGPSAVTAPFLTRGDVGQALQTRLDVIRVDEVISTSRVIADDTAFDGTWLAVRVTAAATTTEDGTVFGLTRAVIDDRVFHAALNVPDTMAGKRLRVGVGTTGWVVFELPEDADTDELELQFVDGTSSRPYGGEIAVTVADVTTADEVVLDRPEWGAAP